MSRAKQSFYENHSGSSLAEINRITATILAGHLLYLTLVRYGHVRSKVDQFSWGFTCYVFNVLLAITVYSTRHGQLLVLYLLPCLVLFFLGLFSKSKDVQTATIEQGVKGKVPSTVPPKQKVAFLSVYRATMMITTVLSILAVDLPIFPRRYAKSETWGTSLMDLGVGSFVFSSGVVSSSQTLGVLAGLKQGGIILAMGITRALMVRGTGYHEHVSEYGVHWNFFITLSLLPPLMPLFQTLRRHGLSFIVQGVLVCIVYQILLLQTGWQAWIIGAYRDNLTSANKEGLSSFVGYISIFLFGLDTGNIVLSKRQRPILTLLLCSSVALITAYLFATQFLNIRVSRRIANAPYIIWIAAHNTCYMLTLAMMERMLALVRSKTHMNDKTEVTRPVISPLLQKINSRGLYVFLGANLMTGAINLAMGDAMMTSDAFTGLSIMIIYSLIISAVTFVS